MNVEQRAEEILRQFGVSSTLEAPVLEVKPKVQNAENRAEEILKGLLGEGYKQEAKQRREPQDGVLVGYGTIVDPKQDYSRNGANSKVIHVFFQTTGVNARARRNFERGKSVRIKDIMERKVHLTKRKYQITLEADGYYYLWLNKDKGIYCKEPKR